MAGWELYLDNAATDPHDEDHVIRMIAAGLPEQTLIRKVGAAEWRGLRSHPPFAVALEARGRAVAHAPQAVPFTAPSMPAFDPSPPSYRWAKVAGVGAGLGSVVVALVLWVGWKASPPPAVIEPPVFTPQNPKQAVTAAPQNPLDIVMTKATLPEALSVARPLMIDQFNASSLGTRLLAVWSIQHLSWKDVAVTVDETSYAKVQKDVDAEREKKLCVSGTIVQIAAANQPEGPLYVGLLHNAERNLFHFHAVKSTGALVEDSPARFCGIIGGVYNYKNSGGGTGHGVDIVGIFDLPENRKK